MKKLVISLMSILMVISLVACSQTEDNTHYGVIQKGVVTALSKNSHVVNDQHTEEVVDPTEEVESNEVEEKVDSVVETKPTETTKPADNAKPTESSKPAENKPADNKPADNAKPAESNKPSHTHEWQPVYKTVTETVHHNGTPDEYKEETVVTGYKAGHQYATFENGHKIYPCEYGYNGDAYWDAVQDYQINGGTNSAYSMGPLHYHTYSVDEYNKITSYWSLYDVQNVTETTRTLVKQGKPAWDETVEKQVVDYYKCSCGATK